MDYQQLHGYMRPPPPPPPPPAPAADPFQRPPLPPPPSHHPWPYPGTQFHYQPQTQQSPSPPPPQWPQPPHTSDHAQYPPHPPPPYQAHQPPHYHAHPQYQHPPPFPPRPPNGPQPYPQDWGNGSWSHQQSWQYPTAVHNNEEDWAARAKAWAAAKSATDDQHTSSQFVPVGRPEEQNHFHEQYPQSMDPQYLEGHMPSAPASNYHQFPVAMRPPNRTGVGQSQDSHYMNSGQSSYGADVHAPYTAREGGVAGDSNTPFLPQEKSPMSPLGHQQEVPSSYSSVAGNVEAGDRYKKINNSSSTPVASLPPHHFQHMPPHHVLSSQPAVTDMSDQPLNFAPHFNRDPDMLVQPNYAHSSSVSIRGGDPTVTMSSNYGWAPPTAPGAAYAPAPSTMPSGSQIDHPMAMPSSVSGHTAPIFPPGPGFQPIVPMVGAAFGVGAGVTTHPTTFPGDAFGSAERPKKVSVPNWLREEIIKNKAVITSSTSAPNLPKEDLQSLEDDDNYKSLRKGDQSDSRSVDSSGSTDDEDEDEVEAARTVAINQEIKRVLTEVLLKVTDELFDEIATEVMKEDDLSVEVGRDSDLSNHRILPSGSSVLTPKASAKVLIPTKAKGSDDEDASEKSASGSPGDILGLGSYASDEEDEIQDPGKPSSKDSSMHQHNSYSSKHLEGDPVIENGSSREETEERRSVQEKLDASSTGRRSPASLANLESNNNKAAKESASADGQHSSRRFPSETKNDSQQGYDSSNLSNIERNEIPDGSFEAKRWMSNDSQIQNIRNGSDKRDGPENKTSSMRKDHKDSESSKGRLDKKGDEEHRRHEEKRARTDRNDYLGKTDEKAKNNESRKRPFPSNDKEGATETHRDKRSTSKKDNDEKQKERSGDERKERSTRHKGGVESSRHKRHRSPSVGPRDRDSSDDSSDDSKRKSHRSRRHKSPSSTRTRKRQVSRSPHSKHSKRRHSPYSSLESSRGKRSESKSRSRSRSRSPVHRRR